MLEKGMTMKYLKLTLISCTLVITSFAKAGIINDTDVTNDVIFGSGNANGFFTVAQDNGIASLAVHGRTRNDFYKGNAEYDTIKAIKQAVSIPVVANGDITSVAKAEQVLSYTGADAIMIGRGAQGRPWIFREINHFLKTGTVMPIPSVSEVRSILLGHVKELHQFYGDFMGVRIARKHVSWYIHSLASLGECYTQCFAGEHGKEFRATFNGLSSTSEQLEMLNLCFDQLVH